MFDSEVEDFWFTNTYRGTMWSCDILVTNVRPAWGVGGAGRRMSLWACDTFLHTTLDHSSRSRTRCMTISALVDWSPRPTNSCIFTCHMCWEISAGNYCDSSRMDMVTVTVAKLRIYYSCFLWIQMKFWSQLLVTEWNNSLHKFVGKVWKKYTSSICKYLTRRVCTDNPNYPLKSFNGNPRFTEFWDSEFLKHFFYYKSFVDFKIVFESWGVLQQWMFK